MNLWDDDLSLKQKENVAILKKYITNLSDVFQTGDKKVAIFFGL